MSHTPSKYQSAIYDWFATGENNAIVSAVAGSGKTTSIVNGMKHLPAGEQRSAFFAAFNKSIVEELKGRLNGSAQCQTMHSLGYGALRQALPSVPKWDIQDYKYREIAKRAKIEASGDRSILQDAIVALHRFAQMSLTPMSNPIKMEEMATLFDVDLPTPIESLIPTIQTLDEEGKRLTELGIISFGDMLYQPIKMAAKFKQYDFVAVDEVQDLSAVQRAVIERTVSRNGRVVGVGDACQPFGTQVLKVINRTPNSMTTEWAEIGTIQVGDALAAPSLSDGHVYSTGMVNGVTHRPFSGQLVTVTTPDGAESSYTPNHFCLTSFAPFKGQCYVYLQRKGRQFRVGVSCNTVGRGNNRFHQENADAMWILQFYQTRNEALMMEKAIAGRFGISDLTWSAVNRQNAILGEAWAFIGDNYERGVECLRFFGKDEKYPLITRKAFRDNKQVSLKRPIVVHASNLITGCLMLRIPQGKTKFGLADWQPITAGTRHYDGPVVSFEIDKYHTYIADGIATHNCQAIYMFAGASPDSFHQVADHFNAQPMPLSICYRCPVNVVNLAKTIVPQIEPWENAQAGIVADIGEDTFQSMLKSGDMILCRLTGPLVKLCFELIAKKIHARIKGRDIGMQLISVVKQVAKIPGFSFDQFLTSLYAHQERQLLKLMAKPGTESQQESLRDRIECLAVCFTSFHSPTLEAFCRDIEGLFADQSAAITLSTIHRAKGLENPRVFIIAPDKLPLVWKGQSPAQAIQEMNLKYVAITRAQDALYFVKPELNGQKPLDFPEF